MPQMKHGVKLPSINANLLYSPNLQNLNKAKIAGLDGRYVPSLS